MDVNGKSVTIMGLGLFGGGVAAARYAAERGARVTVTDLRDEEELAESIEQLTDLSLAYHLGGHKEEDFRGADVVVVNPAVKKDNAYLALARESGAVLTAEMNLLFEACRGQVVGVTGTNGKSTTTAMLHAILERTGGRSWLGGNIGRSLLGDVDRIGPDDRVVLELSSFQLHDLGAAGYSPPVAVVTNFGSSHEKDHGSPEAYRSAKQQILAHQKRGDVAVLNADDPDVSTWATASGVEVLYFGCSDHGRDGVFLDGGRVFYRRGGEQLDLPLADWLRVPGEHNRVNAAAAMVAALAVGATAEHVEAGLRGFEGLPDRLELVGEVGGVRYYNDSIATTPASVMVALDAFAEPIVLVAGGYDKGTDMTELAATIAGGTRAAILIGHTGPVLAAAVRAAAGGDGCRVHECGALPDAVELAAEIAESGDVVLLSPACASYDQFSNYRHRGQCFAEAVRSLPV